MDSHNRLPTYLNLSYFDHCLRLGFSLYEQVNTFLRRISLMSCKKNFSLTVVRILHTSSRTPSLSISWARDHLDQHFMLSVKHYAIEKFYFTVASEFCSKKNYRENSWFQISSLKPILHDNLHSIGTSN